MPDLMNLRTQFENVLQENRELFLLKLKDYGPAWTCFRVPTIADKVLIKAKRIRKLETIGGQGKIPDSIESEYVGICNYCVIAIAILENNAPQEELHKNWTDGAFAGAEYERISTDAVNLVLDKNHDYDDAWLDMSMSSFSDEIFSRMLRIKHMAGLEAGPQVSEGLISQFQDTLNYSIFASLRIAKDD